MGEVKGFMTIDRKDFSKEPVAKRLKHWDEFTQRLPEADLQKQGSRCMDCGVPFCHWGCPVSNIIPDWNDLVYQGRWEEALERLHKTNNFPEITGRICPAPCENSCVLGYNYPAVSIKNIELSIIEKAFEQGWVVPRPPKTRTGKKVAVIGAGPAGLAAADQLNKYGHSVTVYEKNEEVGGILRFGIPDFKLNKNVIRRRVKLMEQEGVVFKTKTHVGIDVKLDDLRRKFDAVLLSGGAEKCRDLTIPGREFKGVYQAMEYLPQQNRINSGWKIPAGQRIDAKGKRVVVLGGGDTGADCVGTANRQGALSVKQFELMPKPPQERSADNPWPQWALIERTSTSHEEGVERDYCIATKSFSGANGILQKLHAARLEFGEKDSQGRRPMKEIPGSEFTVECDLVFLAMGFLGPVTDGMIKDTGIVLDERGNIKTGKNYMSSLSGIFAAGDMRRGQSLVVWAINEGCSAAENINQWLK
ncbi:MAG: glutamate synthase subunit beta [Candidatus Omnitrophica bacterium]|nr:glutamate synthase subunit beta [Candidatus Omnitrophota bacterium]